MHWIPALIALWLAVVGFGQTQTPDAAPPPAARSAADAMRMAKEKQQAAMARQRESVRKQAESVGTTMIPGREVGMGLTANPQEAADPPPADEQEPSTATCGAMADDSVTPIIDGAAKANSVQPKLLRAVIEQESGFHPCAVSPKGAKGMMQLMPNTASDLGVVDPFDPKENIEAGARYLRQLLDKYKGNLSQALGAYNAGPAAVDQAGGIPNIRETRDYVQSIMQKVGTIPMDPPAITAPKPIGN